MSYSFHLRSFFLLLILIPIFSPHVAAAQTTPLTLNVTQSCVDGAPRIALSWNNPNDAVTFALHRTTGSGWKQIATGSASFRSYADTGITGATHSYQIQAIDAAKKSRYSNPSTITVADCTPPPPPPAPAPTARPVLTGAFSCDAGTPRITLNWDNPTNATRFTLHRNPTIGGTNAWGTLATGLTGASFADSGVAARTYQYQLEAIGGNPSPRYSALISVTASTCATPAPTPPRRLKWGAYSGWQDSTILEFETRVGGTPDHMAAFVHWGNNNGFPTYMNKHVKDKGRTLVIFWEPSDHVVGGTVQPAFSADSILAGNHDAYIRRFAEEARAYGAPVILIPFSEMNGNWNPWSGTTNGNTPEKVVASYRHVRTVFGSVPNVKFGWAPNSNSVPDTAYNAIERYYPGDAYVDIVGLDGFNRGTPWLTFDQVFSKPLALLATYNKPIYIFSFASQAGTQKASWITDALTVAMQKYPRLEGWVWFNQNKEFNWLIWSDEASLSAFKNAIK